MTVLHPRTQSFGCKYHLVNYETTLPHSPKLKIVFFCLWVIFSPTGQLDSETKGQPYACASLWVSRRDIALAWPMVTVISGSLRVRVSLPLIENLWKSESYVGQLIGTVQIGNLILTRLARSASLRWCHMATLNGGGHPNTYIRFPSYSQVQVCQPKHLWTCMENKYIKLLVEVRQIHTCIVHIECKLCT